MADPPKPVAWLDDRLRRQERNLHEERMQVEQEKKLFQQEDQVVSKYQDVIAEQEKIVSQQKDLLRLHEEDLEMQKALLQSREDNIQHREQMLQQMREKRGFEKKVVQGSEHEKKPVLHEADTSGHARSLSNGELRNFSSELRNLVLTTVSKIDPELHQMVTAALAHTPDTEKTVTNSTEPDLSQIDAAANKHEGEKMPELNEAAEVAEGEGGKVGAELKEGAVEAGEDFEGDKMQEPREGNGAGGQEEVEDKVVGAGDGGEGVEGGCPRELAKMNETGFEEAKKGKRGKSEKWKKWMKKHQYNPEDEWAPSRPGTQGQPSVFGDAWRAKIAPRPLSSKPLFRKAEEKTETKEEV